MPRAQSDVSWQHQVALEPSACQGGEAGICKSAAALTLCIPHTSAGSTKKQPAAYLHTVHM